MGVHDCAGSERFLCRQRHAMSRALQKAVTDFGVECNALLVALTFLAELQRHLTFGGRHADTGVGSLPFAGGRSERT